MTMQDGEIALDPSNVVRFPIERRATLEILRHIAPDARAVSLLADTYEIVLPIDLEARTDEAAAEFILNQAPASGPEQADMLREMMASVLAVAFEAVRAADLLANTAGIARAQLAAAAAAAGIGYMLQDIERHAADLSLEAAKALVLAHGRALEAYGVARAVDFAHRGEPWTPRQVNADMDWLIEMEDVRRAR